MDITQIAKSIGVVVNITTTGLTKTFPNNMKLVRLDEMDNLIKLKVNIFLKIYAPLGLTQENLDADIEAGVGIATFKTMSKTYRIPTNRFEILSGNTINYKHKVLGINLGLLPENVSLAELMVDIKSVADKRLGIDSKVSEITLGNPVPVEPTQHNIKTLERESLIEQSTSYEESALVYRNEIARLNAIVESLTALVRANQ